jgi:hypothetical protein
VNLLGYRAFATELIKIAIELQDSDIRKLLAERAGQEYLEGGRLPSNGAGEAGDAGYVPELQKKAAVGMASLDPTITPLDRARTKTKSPGAYQQIRDSSMSGLGGAMAGGGVLRLAQGMRKYDPTGANIFKPKTYMAAAGIGAGLGLADRLYRHRHELAFGQEKQANMNSQTFSPGRELTRGHKVGHFENTVHAGSPATASGLMGKAGRLPK